MSIRYTDIMKYQSKLFKSTKVNLYVKKIIFHQTNILRLCIFVFLNLTATGGNIYRFDTYILCVLSCTTFSDGVRG